MADSPRRSNIVRDMCVGFVASAGVGVLTALVLVLAVMLLPVSA